MRQTSASRAIALRYLADGLTVPVDDIIITNGALDALNLSSAARPGDAVIVESPTFYAALQSLERNQLHAIEVATHPREGIDLDALAQAIVRHKPRACWLMTTFQNPLGSLMPDAKKEALVKLRRHGVALIEDDVYGELYFGDKRPRPAKAFDREGIVMHCSSFSKTLAPGYRVGWVAGGAHAPHHAQQAHHQPGHRRAHQAAIAAYLEKGGFDRHLRQFRQQLALQQGEMLQAVARHFPKGTRATRPQGGYFIWVELPERIDTLQLHRAALGHGISIAPGPLFSATGGRQLPAAELRPSVERRAGTGHGDAGQADGRLGVDFLRAHLRDSTLVPRIMFMPAEKKPAPRGAGLIVHATGMASVARVLRLLALRPVFSLPAKSGRGMCVKYSATSTASWSDSTSPSPQAPWVFTPIGMLLRMKAAARCGPGPRRY